MGSTVKWCLLLLLSIVLLEITGCETSEPQNASVRPWNAPQGWEGSSPLMNEQHQ